MFNLASFKFETFLIIHTNLAIQDELLQFQDDSRQGVELELQGSLEILHSAETLDLGSQLSLGLKSAKRTKLQLNAITIKDDHGNYPTMDFNGSNKMQQIVIMTHIALAHVYWGWGLKKNDTN